MNLVKKVIISMFVLLVSCGVCLPVNASMPKEKPSFKVVLLGDSGVGKTSLLQRVYNNKFDENQANTVGVEYFLVNLEQYNIEFWDTAGQEKFRNIIRAYFRNASVAIIVFDASDENTIPKEQCLYWLDCFREQVQDAKIFIVANKIDQMRESMVEDVSEIKEFCERNGYSFLETSAKDNIGIDELKSQIVDLCEELYRPNTFEEISSTVELPVELPNEIENSYSYCSYC